MKRMTDMKNPRSRHLVISSLAKEVIFILLLFLCCLVGSVPGVHAAETSGGINWIDPLNYDKPQFVAITVPDEATATKYYVSSSGSSGNNCLSEATPCNSLTTLAGKSGSSYDALRGGPAYVYIWGTNFNPTLTSSNFYGSAGNEIIIKPLAGQTATFVRANSVHTMTTIHHIIYDGGPDLGISFINNGQSDDPDYGMFLYIDASNVTFYRIRIYATTTGRLMCVGLNTTPSYVQFINDEFYQCNQSSGYQCSSVYWGCGPSGGGGLNGLMQNNIIRSMGGDGIEIAPRGNTSVTVTGNAMHDIGKRTCSGSWDCRPAITIDSNGGTVQAVTATNNLIFDIGGAGIWAISGTANNNLIYNNTIYDYSNGGSGSGVCMQGICNHYGRITAVVRNNIIYDPSGVNPFSGTLATITTNNLCGSGKSCGTSSQTYSSNTLLSTDQNHADFLKISPNSPAKDAGVNVGITIDYIGALRPYASGYDIGAIEYIEYSSSDPAPMAPYLTKIQ